MSGAVNFNKAFGYLNNAVQRFIRVLGCLFLVLFYVPCVSAAPDLFWGSDPVRPGEVALLIGDGLDSVSHVFVSLSNNDKNASSSQEKPGLGQEAEILDLSNESLKLLVPEDLQEGVYRVEIHSANGVVDYLLNRPAIYWLQGDAGLEKGHSGRWLRIFGRNISHDPKQTVILLRAKDGRTREIAPTSASLWEATFSLPKDLPPGHYTLRLYNGKGEGSAWSSEKSLDIVPSPTWPSRIFNVREFGATGAGDPKDSDAIKAAIRAAEANGGGVVFFPRGRYQVTGTLEMPQFVALRGERRDWVSLFWPDTDDPPEALIYGTDHFALEDLTIYASRHKDIITNIAHQGNTADRGAVRLERLTIRASSFFGRMKPEAIDERFRNFIMPANGPASIRLTGADLMLLENDIYGSSRAFVLEAPRGAYVARNRFHNGRKGWYSISGADGVIFEDNEVIGADLMATGGGVNTLGGKAYSQNVYFGRNRFSLLHGYEREAMTTDGPGGLYYGHVKAIDDTTVELMSMPAEPGRWEKGTGFFVLGGKGMGQFAQVQSIQGNEVKLDRPLQVLPDESSWITVTAIQQNYIFLNNEFSDAGVAIQYYGTSVNHVAVGNRSVRTGGFLNSGRWYRHYQPSWYCQFLENEIVEGNMYQGGPNRSKLAGEAVLGSYATGSGKSPMTAPLVLATIHRRNHLHSNAHIEILGKSGSVPGIREVIVENNVIENSDLGLKVDAGVRGLLKRGNVFQHVREPFQGSGAEVE